MAYQLQNLQFMPAFDFETIVVGGGPGGLVSALYLGRFRRSVLLVKNGRPRATWIPRTMNVLGYDRGISGSALLRRLNSQISQINVVTERGEAHVEKAGNGFKVRVGKNIFKSRKVILATGIEDVQPDVENLLDLRKQGLMRYCAICDAYDFRDQPLAVLVSDAEGIRKAQFISRFSQDLTILAPKDYFPAPPSRHILKKIKARFMQVESLKIDPQGSKGVRISTPSEKIWARAIYVELGSKVIDSAFKTLNGLKRAKSGHIITTTEQKTSIPHLFAVGDCVNLLGQISVAAGQAAVAATTIHNDL